MDLKQLEYIVQIAQEGTITKAAEKLYITQSALTQHLGKIERELGTPLFYRSRAGFHTTDVGKAYLESATEILRIRRETYNKIEDIVKTGKGTLSVGFTPGHGVPMFAGVYPAFHRQFPQVLVTPLELGVRQQQERIAAGEIDVGFVTLLDSQRTGDQYIDICREEIVLALPQSHPLANRSSLMENRDLAAFGGEDFVLLFRQSTLRPVIDSIFQKAGIAPRVLFETYNTTTIVTMVKAGLCCSIIPISHIKDDLDSIACLHLPSRPSWSIAASYKKGSYLSDAAREFIHHASAFWLNLFQGQSDSL